MKEGGGKKKQTKKNGLKGFSLHFKAEHPSLWMSCTGELTSKSYPETLRQCASVQMDLSSDSASSYTLSQCSLSFGELTKYL